MNAPTDLEDRLRRGLRAGAAALPAAPAPDAYPRQVHKPPSRVRWVVLALGSVAAAAAIVVGAVVVVNGTGDDDSDVELGPAQEPRSSDTTEPEPSDTVESEPTDTPPTDTPPTDTEVTPTNGNVPGQAVLIDDEIRTYGPDGAQTGTVSFGDILDDVEAVSSDLSGGWVGCGYRYFGDGSFRMDLVWLPADGEPVLLTSTRVQCFADGVQVVDSPEGPTVIYYARGPNQEIGPFFRAVVLATDENRELSFPLDPAGFYSWGAATGKVLFYDRELGAQLFDLATGEALPVAPIHEEHPVGNLVLAPDGATAALLTGDIVSTQTDLVVYDLVTGAELYRETFPVDLEGAQVSYDGTTVAVGDYGDASVTVFDLTTPSARHTIDAPGVPL